jgi:hypothetical protein
VFNIPGDAPRLMDLPPRNRREVQTFARTEQSIKFKTQLERTDFGRVKILENERNKESIYGLPLSKTIAEPNIPGIHLYAPTPEFSLPFNFCKNIWRFRTIQAHNTTKIIGKRNEVHIDGAHSEPWKKFCNKLDTIK